MPTAKMFMYENSQAIRIPKKFRAEGGGTNQNRKTMAFRFAAVNPPATVRLIPPLPTQYRKHFILYRQKICLTHSAGVGIMCATDRQIVQSFTCVAVLLENQSRLR